MSLKVSKMLSKILIEQEILQVVWNEKNTVTGIC